MIKANDSARLRNGDAVDFTASQSLPFKSAARVNPISGALGPHHQEGRWNAKAPVGTDKLKMASELGNGLGVVAWLTRVRKFCAGSGITNPCRNAGLVMPPPHGEARAPLLKVSYDPQEFRNPAVK